MKKIRITAPAGAAVSGPMRVRLTMDQHALNSAVLGPRWPRGGVFDVPEGRAITLEPGDQVLVADPDALAADDFEPVGWARPAKTKGKPGKVGKADVSRGD